MLPRSAIRPVRRSQRSKFAVNRTRLRQPSIDAEPPRNPIFDAIGRGLMTLGQKVTPRGFDPGRI